MKLKDEDIKTEQRVSRRKFLSKIGVGAAGAAAVVAASVAIAARDAKDFIPADNKSQDLDRSQNADKKRDSDKRQGDQA